MTETEFNLLETCTRADRMLRRAQRRRFADPIEIARLKFFKLRLRDRLARLAPNPLPAC